MPAREAFAPRRRPVHNVLRLSLFPKGKIVRGAFVALAVEFARTFEGVLEIASAEHSVVMVGVVLAHVEVDAAVALVSIARVEYLLHGLNLLDYMPAGARLDRRRCHIEQAHGLMVAQGVGLHDFHGLELLQPCLLCDFVLALVSIVFEMAHIGDVTHIAHLVAQVAQQFAEHIEGYSRAGVSQMGITVNCRTADIHPGVTGINRLEDLLAVGHCIG